MFFQTAASFAIEHQRHGGVMLLNQLLGSPADGGIGRIYSALTAKLRCRSRPPVQAPMAGSVLPETALCGKGRRARIRHRLSLSLHPRDAAWLWRLEAKNTGAAARSLDAILIQDIGLGDRGFLMNNEAYAFAISRPSHRARIPVSARSS